MGACQWYIYLPHVLLDLTLLAQSFRLLLVTSTNTHNVQNTWPGTDLSICPPLALDYHSKSLGLSSSLGKDQSVWRKKHRSAAVMNKWGTGEAVPSPGVQQWMASGAS